MGKQAIRLSLSDNPSKAEEIHFLERLTEFFQSKPNTYLTEMFSQELFLAISARIRNDFPCNLIEIPFGY